MLTIALALLATDAHGFCGTYVGSPGSKVTNYASQVVMVREGNRTTLTLANDVTADTTDFALVIPVPEVLGPEDVSVVESDMIGRLDRYSSPRLVRYEAADFNDTSSGCSLVQPLNFDDTLDSPELGGDEGEPVQVDEPETVTVEASFSAGEYDILVLSAEESASLYGWLERNGYALPEGGEDVVQEYIDAGSYFVAAKVRLDAEPTGDYLSPLRLSYTSDVMSLPLRLGTVSSEGEQDLIVYTITKTGSVDVSNVPQATVPDECMFAGRVGETFPEYYDETLDDSMAETGGASYTKEYAWAPYHCDPCADTPLTDTELQSLGYSGTSQDAYLTRLRLRYGPDDLDQDVVFYETGMAEQEQIRFIQFNPELFSQFDTCENRSTLVTSAAGATCDVTAVGQGAMPWLLACFGAAFRRRQSSRPRSS